MSVFIAAVISLLEHTAEDRNIESSPSQPLKQPNCTLHDHFALQPLFILYSTRRFKTERIVLTIHRTIQPFKTKPYNIAIIVYTTLLTNPVTACVVHCKVYTYVRTYVRMRCTVCAHVYLYTVHGHV